MLFGPSFFGRRGSVRGVGFLFCLVGAFAIPSVVSAQFRVLIYHAHPDLGYAEERFRSHMDFLVANDYHTVTPSQLLDWMEHEAPMPVRPIVLTIDDSYILVHTSVYPILAERGLNITNFVITDSVGRTTGLHYCNWDELAEMEGSGAALNQSHSKTHPFLTQIPSETARAEIEDSKRALEEGLPGLVCDFFAYPYGDYNADIQAMAVEAGYRAAFAVTVPSGATIVTPNTPRFEIPRIGVDRSDLDHFRASIGFNDLPPAPPGGGWTLDNRDVNFFCDRVAWSVSSSTTAYGGDFRKRYPMAAATPARWAVHLPRTGWYRVHAWWPADPTLARDAVYEIHSNPASGALPQKVSSVTVDQTKNTGRWNLLGLYSFSESIPARVHLLSHPSAPVAADGIWFEPADPPNGWMFH